MIKLITDIITGLYNVFNVVIPGFGISISNIFLGLAVVVGIGMFLKFSFDKFDITRGGK